MRRARFLLAIVLAWALAAEGLLGHAAAAHRLVSGKAGPELCLDKSNGERPSQDAACDAHCIFPSGADTPASVAIAKPRPRFVAVLETPVAPTGSEARRLRGHGSRDPPVRT